MKQQYHDIALKVGGSHYPEVGGKLLEKFADQLIADCINLVNQHSVLAAQALSKEYTTVKE